MDFPHNPAHPGDVIREGCLGEEPPRSAAIRLELDPDEFRGAHEGARPHHACPRFAATGGWLGRMLPSGCACRRTTT